MNVPADDQKIARVAYAIWEAEGRPEGRGHEHWMRARQLVEEGRAEDVYQPDAGAAPRRVQPGFEDAPPGIVPDSKDEPAEESPEQTGGRFASQLADLPEERPAD